MRSFFNGILIIISTLIIAPICTLGALVPVYGERLFFFWARLWCLVITAGCGVKVRGELPPPGTIDWNKPHVFMSNHQSHYDVPCITRVVPSYIRFLTKKELSHIPIFGWALRAAGFVFIDRNRRTDAFRSIENAAADLVKKDHSIVVFPEGTRSPDGRLQSFKKGGFHLAIMANAVIVPIGVTGTIHVLSKKSSGVKPGNVVVRVGTPILASTYGKERINELMADVHSAVEKLVCQK